MRVQSLRYSPGQNRQQQHWQGWNWFGLTSIFLSAPKYDWCTPLPLVTVGIRLYHCDVERDYSQADGDEPCSCLSSFPLKKTVYPSSVVISPKVLPSHDNEMEFFMNSYRMSLIRHRRTFLLCKEIGMQSGDGCSWKLARHLRSPLQLRHKWQRIRTSEICHL